MYDVRAQSEVLGTILLVAITVTAVTILGLIVVSDLLGEEEQVSAIIEGEVTTETVEFRHGGGDPLQTADLVVVVRNDSVEERLAFHEEEGLFRPGQRRSIDCSCFDEGEEVRLILAHRPTGSLLFDGVRVVG